MRINPFGRHLHSQIIWPLMIASVMIAVVATVGAVRIIGTIVDGWIADQGESAGKLVELRIERQTHQASLNLKLIAANPMVVQAVASGDVESVQDSLDAMNRTLGADEISLIDGDGRVIASTGRLRFGPGDRPYGSRGEHWETLPSDEPLIARSGKQYAIGTVLPAGAFGGRQAYYAISMRVDTTFMAGLGAELDVGVVLIDAEGRPVASSVGEWSSGELLLSEIARRTTRQADSGSSPVAELESNHTLDVGGAEYVVIGGDMRFINDPDATYLVSVTDSRFAGNAKQTTTGLILLWSIFAVGALLTLNWWVARDVSRPLAELSDNVGRVARGEYDAKVEPAGASEVSALAENFNQMTDSLRERTDTLTKKVSELATLYEMSRALGSTLELDTLLTSVLDSAMRIFDVEIGYVTMVDRDTGSVQVRAWRGIDMSRPDDSKVRSSMSDWVIKEGRPLIFNPPSEAEGPGRGDAVSGAAAALCVPLLSSEGTLGAITVGSRNVDQRFTSDDVRLLATIANHVTMAIGNIGLFSSVQEAYLATVRALAAAVDAKDPYTRGHSDGVAAYALRVGDVMKLSPEQMISLEMAAYLHDIGKIGISEEILLKPGKLTDSEMSQMRHHPLIGANILKPVTFPWPIAPIVRHHHEHYDGRGYPAGLKGDEIPILARILTVSDAYEAMVSDRPYRRGMSQQEAFLELRRCAGAQFDPRVVEIFIAALEALGDTLIGELDESGDLGPEETQAVLVAVCDGMFSSFRRLGGPRLANNVERAVNGEFAEGGIPLVLRTGHIAVRSDEELSEDALTAHLRLAAKLMALHIERASGVGLADHFLGEALEALPERMRRQAGQLGITSAG